MRTGISPWAIPLHRTPVYGFFNSLMELVASMDGDRVYAPDYLKFVLHPYTKNICFKENAEITRILLHTLEEELTSSRGRTFLTLSEIEEDPDLFKEVAGRMLKEGMAFPEEELKDHLKEIHHNTIIPNSSPFKECPRFCHKIDSDFSISSSAGARPGFTPSFIPSQKPSFNPSIPSRGP